MASGLGRDCENNAGVAAPLSGTAVAAAETSRRHNQILLSRQGVPSFCSHPWCPSYTPTAPLSTVSGTACWWREGLKCAPADQLLAARLHVSLRRPGDTCSPSSTNISRRRLPGPRNGFVGHRSWSSTNISQLLSTSHHSGRISCVRLTNIRTCCDPSQLHHTPLQNARLQCHPTCKAPEKNHS